MEESWDADDFEPKLATTLTAASKWEGEDEDDEIKESWEDEEEEKKDQEKPEPIAPPKPKKKLFEKIAEKERLQREELERRKAEAEENLTPEQKLAEKLRRQKLQEESDLQLALETFGITETNGVGKLDSFNPTSKEEFDELADLLAKKVTLYKNSEDFPAFVEDLVSKIIVQMSSVDIKRVKQTVDNIHNEKQKSEKGDKNKKASKGKGKAKLKMEGDNAHLNQYDSYGNYDDDYNDFM